MLLKYIIIIDLCVHKVMYTVETDDIITFIKHEFGERYNYIIYSSNIYEYSDEAYEELYKLCKLHYDVGIKYN